MTRNQVTKNGFTFTVRHREDEEFQCAEISLGDNYLGAVYYGPDFDKRLEDRIEELSQREYNFN